ncbi:MAG: hypothetical protein JW716_02155 [Candidatus Aenigmarchaeota archaeon]|nr:hypothetical protein [Candidatus Aenigmarchaeota archaeon]
MDSDTKDKIQKKMKDGWIKSWMMIEVMAVSESAAKSSLEKHVQKMETEKGAFLYDKKFGEMDKIDNPLPNVPHGFSYVVEFEILTQNLDRLMTIVMNYGPSSVEILEPDELKIPLGEAQGILNSVSAMMHKFASQTGGIIVSS